MVTLTRKTLVHESFAMIAPLADDVAQLFYSRAVEFDASLISLRLLALKIPPASLFVSRAML
jgi:hypothetical protein